jgi:hypothetical protein
VTFSAAKKPPLIAAIHTRALAAGFGGTLIDRLTGACGLVFVTCEHENETHDPEAK